MPRRGAAVPGILLRAVCRRLSAGVSAGQSGAGGGFSPTTNIEDVAYKVIRGLLEHDESAGCRLRGSDPINSQAAPPNSFSFLLSRAPSLYASCRAVRTQGQRH